ncbi:MAG TPA: 4-hydroxy-3-methylbut-2-enyl diphosphate reductase [Spirochaetota bacterium]|nr:4-hydroxy-3-methylbut-2-enyl diphosphate reductase [Spirochaetota bacterium]
MKIELSSHSGFCMGVRSAVLRIVNEINNSGGEIFVHGPIIHNPQTISILEKRGLVTVPDDVSLEGKTVAVRTHGIPRQRLREIRDSSARLINLTCPRVANVQAIIMKHSRQGCFTIITGDNDHAEVVGLKSYASAGVLVVSSPADLERVPEAEKYIAVSQTTFDRTLFETIIEKLKAKLGDRLLVFNTICDSTHNRQDDVTAALARGIDALVVVGGKNSANTRRLAELGRERGIRTYHVETAEELLESGFRKNDHVFITAGASTPGWIINNVLEKLYTIQYRHGNAAVRFFKGVLEFAVRTNILSAAASFFITGLSAAYAGFSPDYRLSAAAALYIFSMYTFNNFFTIPFLKESNPYKFSLYHRHRHALLAAASILTAVSAALVAGYPVPIAAVFYVSVFLGVIYSTPLFKRLVRSVDIGAVTRIYNSKTVATTFGWVILTSVLPLLSAGAGPASMAAMTLLVFGFVFLRNILLDLIALQGDLILGRETLPILAGTRVTKWLATGIALASLAVFVPLTLCCHEAPYLLMALPHACYLGLLFYLVRLDYLAALKYEFLVDLNLVVFVGLYWLSSSL